MARALGWSTISSAVILLLNIATGVLLARALGPELRGALAAAILWPALVSVFGLLGLVESVSYFTARAERPEGDLLGSALVLALGLSVLTIGLTAAALPLVLAPQTGKTLSDAYLYLASIPVVMLTTVLAGYINGRQRYRWVQYLRISVVLVAATCLGAVALAGHLSVHSAIIVYLAANLISAAMAVAMTSRVLQEPMRASRETARALISFGLRSFASTAAWRTNERIDQPMIAALLAPAQLGLYVTAVAISSVAGIIGSSVIFVGLPAMAALTDADDRRRLASGLIGLTLLASAALTLPLLVGARFLLDLLFGPEFAVVAPVARILLVAAVVLSVNRAIESMLVGIGRPGQAARAELLSIPVTLVGLVVLLPTIGLVGAGWASLVAYLTAFALMSRSASAALELPLRRLLVPARTDVVMIVRRLRRR